MPRETEFLAREICRRAGYDPDQIVAEFDREKDFDYLHIGLVPVEIKKLKPVFTKFFDEAERQIQARASQERSSIAVTSS